MRVLLKFGHGLGDAVQMTIVLKHLKKYMPNWLCDVWALQGKHSAMRGLASHVYSDLGEQPREAEYDQILNLAWFECNQAFDKAPSTKAALCLAEVFHIEPDAELFTYEIYPTQEAEVAAEEYLRNLSNVDPTNGKYPVAFVHYQGNTSADQKNLNHEVALEVCRSLMSAGLIPIILDWDRRSPLPDNREIFCPAATHPLWGGFGSGDAGILAALIERASIMIGIDSGPLHVAGSTTTPTIGVWTHHLPIKYFDIADNVTHLVPKEWREQMREVRAKVFEKYYKYVEQTETSIARDIVRLASDMLNRDMTLPNDGSLVMVKDFLIRKDNVHQDLTIIDDVFYNDCYKTNIIQKKVSEAKVVVDVGAHIGSFAKLIHEKNPSARIFCVEACPENIEALQSNVGHFATVIHAACSYESEPIALCNAVRPNCESTGGSRVVKQHELMEVANGQYWPDTRPLPKVTLEALSEYYGFETIDILKLDCEESEYSILGNCDLSRLGFILGEYHGQDRWDRFRAEKFADWDYGHMSQGSDMGNFHLVNKDCKTTIKVAVPPGIGDTLWAVAKMQSMMKAHPKAKSLHIAICQGYPQRSKEFLERFDFVDSVSYTHWSCVEANSLLPDGTVNYAKTGRDWHHEFDWILVPNATLERGERLETWQPEWEINWSVMDHWQFSEQEMLKALDLKRKLAKYAVVYASSMTHNGYSGHNRNGIWTMQDWGELVRAVKSQGVPVVLVGAECDLDYAIALRKSGVVFDEDFVGRMTIGETLATIRMSSFGVYFQSGLGVASTYFGVPTAMWWRQHGDSILPNAYQTFDERMATAWVPPHMLEDQSYMPLYYGKEKVQQIIEQITARGWCG